jgi:adenine-specific DNA-methyltransferase
MNDNQAKFQNLLRELFQFDCADLDFGIYRIMNYKRAVIERFITEDLPKAIAEELEQGALAEQSQAAQALESARKKVLGALGKDALDADGNLNETYRATNVGREYIEAQRRAQGSRSREALEAAIYNHLYVFFSRYWQDGDFISKRRYSKKERYAIPYNGEEVYLYWANHDQYYIKTGEYFTDYTYKAPNGVTVHFKLRQADVEQNNVKGEKRFFLPLLKEIAWDETARQLTIPFEYRPLSEQETITYGQKNQQEAIIAKAVAEIPKRIKVPEALAALTAERRYPGNADVSSALEYHLRQYTRRNTSDFFIHKDLKGFLSRELDFYLKNEVLNLEELEAAGEHLAQGWFQLMRLIKRIGLRIIEFLAQIEDFQKMLWEKKKFVTEVFYLVKVGNIPESFYTEIAACEAQWEEWKTLFAIEELHKNLLSGDVTTTEGRIAFLKAHPTLVLDTRHFSADFTDRLLASFDDLDEMTDGLLVHGENWQALNLLQEKYRERVKCIYIDPPYNTGNDQFIYRDSYQHSSWLAMMAIRLALIVDFLRDDGALFVSIDANERDRLRILAEVILGAGWYLNTFVWINNLKGRQISGRGAAGTHEYVLAFGGKGIGTLIAPVTKFKDIMPSAYKGFDYETKEDAGGSYVIKNELYNTNSKFNEETRPNLVFNIHYNFATGEVRFSDVDDDIQFEGFVKIPPKKNNDGSHKYHAWRWGKEKIQRDKAHLEFIQTEDGVRIYTKVRGFGTTTLKDVLTDISTSEGGKELFHLFGAVAFVDYPKPVALVEVFASQAGDVEFIADFFAGSGTTGHAVINLNREDGGRRKFILVEMAQYFDTVLLPRIKKVTFSPEWKDGKPKRMATPEEAERSPRIVKVIRLESYEDALNNLTFDDANSQQALELFRDDYLLSYMLRWETRHSETLLNVEKLQSPFSYKLHLHRDGETRERTVDLPETFNYLLGLDVQTRRVLPSPSGRGAGGEGRYLVYRGTLRNGRTVVILWRETKDWTEEDYRRERDFVKEQKLTEGADEIYVNGDSRIPGARSLDPIFKERMFATVEGWV